jgi:hypothetical protein
MAARGFQRDIRARGIRQGKNRLSAGGPTLQFGGVGAQRQHRQIKNSPRAAERSDCFEAPNLQAKCAPNLGSKARHHDKSIVRRSTAPINTNAAELRSRAELNLPIMGWRPGGAAEKLNAFNACRPCAASHKSA